VGDPEIKQTKLRIRSHAYRPGSLQLLGDHGQSFLQDPRAPRSSAPRSLIEKPAGVAHRRHGKGQTFAGEIAAAPPSSGSLLDRAVEWQLVRRNACMARHA
jgi:hypothetical protein